jgi:hypothetical protein
MCGCSSLYALVAWCLKSVRSNGSGRLSKNRHAACFDRRYERLMYFLTTWYVSKINVQGVSEVSTFRGDA